MKKYISILALLFVYGCSLVSNNGDLSEPSTDIVQYQPPHFSSWQLENGLTVFFLEDKEIPLVNGSLFFNGGSLWEEGKDRITVEAMGDLMRVGGTLQQTPQQLDYELLKLAASVSSGFDSEYGKASFQSLNTDLEEVFSLFSDVILRPRFDVGRLDTWRASALDSVKRRKDDSGTIASIALSEILFSSTPYGYISTSVDVEAVSRDRLIAAHKKYVRPNGAYLLITGAVDKSVIEKLIASKFSDWKPRQRELGSLPPAIESYQPQIAFVEMPEAKQASVYVGQFGVQRHSKDRYAIATFNDLFGGGGFDSRLMRKVRTDLGLAYSIYGAISPGRVVGKNIIAMQTKSESTFVALSETIKQLELMQAELITDKELNTVKKAAENAFVFKYDTPMKLIQRKALLRILGFPDSYDENYLENLFKVSKKDVKTVAQKRWDTGKFVIVVVGDKNAYTQLKSGLEKTTGILKDYEILRRQFNEKLL